MNNVVDFPSKKSPHSVDDMMKELNELHAAGKLTKLMLVGWMEGGCITWRTKMGDEDCAYGIMLLHHRLMLGLNDAWQPA